VSIRGSIDNLKNILDDRKDLRQYLFKRGFFLSDRSGIDLQSFPFYGQWKTIAIGCYTAYVHELQKVSVFEKDNRFFFLFGHAYNPFTMEIDETSILSRIADAYQSEDYWDRINEITGVFVYGVICGQNVEFITDPSGMQSSYYGLVDGHFTIASHVQIVGDLHDDLQMNDLTKELLQYKYYYRVLGAYLPADMTKFDAVKRIVPNIDYRYDGKNVTHKRFWPTKNLSPAVEQDDYEKVIHDAAEILKNSMHLVARKWSKPYISLTGGIDSNTTFAAANGIYDHFKAFSYISAPKEAIDAAAAEKIARRFNVEWLRFQIPSSNDDVKDFKESKAIIDHNNGYIFRHYDNEYRKRIILMRQLDCDVEVKSWVSEVIRAYWYKHYGRSTMPPLSPKLFRNLYKIFIFNRRLAHKIDAVFAKYIQDFEYETIPDGYPPADMHKVEVALGSWGGMGTSEMKMYSDITYIYDNRKFFDLLFRVPLDKRISDEHHLDMKKILNKELYDMHIRVVNLKETDTRALLLNVIFNLNRLLP
jgi:hypothetical protein